MMQVKDVHIPNREGVIAVRVVFPSASWRSVIQEYLGEVSFPFEKLSGDFCHVQEIGSSV